MMCCYYPTTTVAIDDDVDFLRIVTQHLGISDCISYSSPNKAIKSLKDQDPFERMRSRIFKTTNTLENSSCPEDHAILINMRRLYEEIYNKNRFKDVSVLIVDYYMDDISGIDVCEELANHPAKKILLTGGTDKEKIAIEAFNKGIIHRFISKSDPNFPTQLKQSVTTLKESYFRDLTSMILPHLPTTETQLLQKPAYINFIRNLQIQFNATEFYTLDNSGSCIFLDSQGNPMWLIVKHESEISDYENIAINQDATSAIIQALIKRERIPFFFSDDDYQHPVDEWEKFLLVVHPLPDMAGYYFGIAEGNIRNNLKLKNIVSYQRILSAYQ